MNKEMEELLKTWCDRLLIQQMPEAYGPGLAGGFICPACARIHGRCADAAYGLMRMAKSSGDETYMDAAIRVQDWANRNVAEPDGSWINDVAGMWKGITVFGTIALGESLRLHGDLLPARVRDGWRRRLRAAADYLMQHMHIEMGNINYPLTATAAFAVASLALDDAKYAQRAQELAHEGLGYFTERGLLFGEGRPLNVQTPRGCRPIDLGYNVEESIPGLILYAKLLDDEAVLDAMAHAVRAHLEFMLPDGAWDNSWGTRNSKWTYWGSRTSDGCQPGFVMLADRDPVFAEAAYRNLKLLERCTHNGLLYGGPDLHHHGDEPCVHHTFCHVKALAACLDWFEETGHPGQFERVPLPCDDDNGLEHFAELDTWLASKGPWRATVTANDAPYTIKAGHASGGALSMLYHKRIGPILTASMSVFNMVEPHNMQRHRGTSYLPLTPRLELIEDGTVFSSVLDGSAAVQVREEANRTTFTVNGHLRDAGQRLSSSEQRFEMSYDLEEETIEILVAPAFAARFILPVIARSDEEVQVISETGIVIVREDGRIRIATNRPIQGGGSERVYNHVPGFEAVPLSFEMSEQLVIRISAAD